MKKEQSAKLLKEIEKFNFIKYKAGMDSVSEDYYEKQMQLCCMMIAGFKTEEIAAIWMQSIFS